MAGHTPGPWHFNGKSAVVGPNREPVAVLLARTDKEDIANRRLIAAAPELMELVQRLKFLLHVRDDEEELRAEELTYWLARADTLTDALVSEVQA